MDPEAFITSRLDDMLNSGRGPMWGGPEAYELQVLLLLEVLYCREDPQRLMRRYNKFVAVRHPNLGCRVMSAVIVDHAVLANELHAFKAFLTLSESIL